jgi:hypothetical protein
MIDKLWHGKIPSGDAHYATKFKQVDVVRIRSEFREWVRKKAAKLGMETEYLRGILYGRFRKGGKFV